jgi:hypothetical protein
LTILLDKVLYDVDRSIDLYALGNTGFGLPERRASAYSYLIQQVINDLDVDNSLNDILKELSNLLAPLINERDDAELSDILVQLESQQINVASLSEYLNKNLQAYTTLSAMYSARKNTLTPQQRAELANYRSIDLYLEPIHQELCMQLSLEDQWQRLLQSMAPNCSTSAGLSETEKLLKAATTAVNGRACEESHLHIPPQLETTFDQFVNNISTKGMGRRRAF